MQLKNVTTVVQQQLSILNIQPADMTAVVCYLTTCIAG